MITEKDSMITKELLMLFDEVFEKVHGQFLDQKTSIFETIDGIASDRASLLHRGFDETIAGHVAHMTFYIVVLQEYITDRRTGKTDWGESWRVKTATPEEWKLLKETLLREYRKLVLFIESVEEWTNGDYLGGFISILAHCAYHLGAIRQLNQMR